MTAVVIDAAVPGSDAAHRAAAAQSANAALVARIERLPISRRLLAIRVIVGIATFFDAYAILAIAFAMPELVREWKLGPGEIGLIISAGYIGQLVGAVSLGWLAEKVGRLHGLL